MTDDTLKFGDHIEFGCNDLDNQYLATVHHIAQGTYSTNRTGVATYKQFGHFISTELADGLSVLTTKRVYLRPNVRRTVLVA